MEELKTVWWDGGAVCLLDQTRLPREQVTVRCRSVAEVAAAIRSMVVRGAPAIGITAAYGMALAVQVDSSGSPTGFVEELRAAKEELDATRPTAVNLSWATSRMLQAGQKHANSGDPAGALLDEAHAIREEDERICREIGAHGAALLRNGSNVLTHCNAGGLATAGYGTALAPVKTAHERGNRLHVLVDETRPFMQGSRLTAWELQRAGVEQTLITDNMAGYFMRQGRVDCVIVGADRIVANGDVANKIGTYSLAVLAGAHSIPFYVAAPTSTIDMSLATADEIVIEQRDPGEVTRIAGHPLAPEGVSAAHPAFDTTPHELVTAIITERGVIEPPFAKNLQRLMHVVAAEPGTDR